MSAARITAAELFDQQAERLEMRWLAGQGGAAARVRAALSLWVWFRFLVAMVLSRLPHHEAARRPV